MQVKVGAIDLQFDVELAVLERNREDWTAKMRVAGADDGLGGAVNATMTMVLLNVDMPTELFVHIDAKLLGKLGEFGQPVMRKKAKTMTAEFAQRINDQLAPREAALAPHVPPDIPGRRMNTKRHGGWFYSLLTSLREGVRSRLRHRASRHNRRLSEHGEVMIDGQVTEAQSPGSTSRKHGT
jgi:hypothetical protein